jgi:XTP/dITP diphosphohydrolase
MKIVLATGNPGKLAELTALSKDVSESELQFELELVLAPPGFDPAETGLTYTENALIKARAAAHMTGLPAIADDSGLEVDALDGRPGIHSARYCEGSDADRRTKLIAELKSSGRPEKGAAFVCAMALVDGSGGELFTCEVRWPGTIGLVEQGENGFGFDPLFHPAGFSETAAQLEPAHKNKISHRGQAWVKMLQGLKHLSQHKILGKSSEIVQ